MKTFKSLLSEKDAPILNEGISVAKLKRLKLVSDEEFGKFVQVMKKMDNDKPIQLKEKDVIIKVFNELVNAIINDQALMQKIAKRNDGEGGE
jgi:hypothetical protein|tara:strand:+ start:262 stop:537 length:276 start_codon:yes stop_codon:yes gene_type:complete